MKYSVFIATTLDGYIASKDGSISWLEKFQEDIPPWEDLGYSEFINDIDVLIMWRKTYEKILSFNSWPYTIPVIVLSSHQNLNIPPWAQIRFVHWKTPIEISKELEAQGYQHAYIDGGETIQSFLEAGLINTIIITQIPLLLGNGIPLFWNHSHPISLQLVRSRVYPCGLVQNKYNVV